MFDKNDKMKRQLLLIIAIIASGLFLSNAALATQNASNSKINQLSLLKKSTIHTENVERSAPTFRLKDSRFLSWNSISWDTLTKSEYSYTQSTVLSQSINSQYSSGTYTPSDRSLFTYDSQGRLTMFQLQTWNGSVWENYYRNTTAFNSNGDISLEYQINWFGGTWDTIYGRKHIYVYDMNNHMTNYIQQVLDNGVWVNEYQETYTVNAQGAWLTFTTQEWDANLNSWENLEYYYNITWYDFSQMLPSSADMKTWNGSAWEDNSQFLITYTGNGDPLIDLYKEWNGSAWVNSEQTTYNYTNNLLTLELYQEWNGQWDNLEKYEYQYDTYGNVTLSTDWSYNGSWNQFAGDRYTYAYDANGNMLKNIIENFDNIALFYFNNAQFLYSYDNVTSINNIENNSMLIYPNPSSETLFVKGMKANDNTSIEILSLDGKLIHTYTQVSEESKIDIRNFDNGVYIIRAISNSGIQTSKFIKQ